MKKLLYVDVPFEGLHGGDKNRSNFIWNTLKRNYDADLLLICPPEYSKKAVPEHSGYDTQYLIPSTEPLPWTPAAIYAFSTEAKRKFKDILDRKRYEIIVFRFLSTYPLAKIAASILPSARIVIDVDMLFSRISELSWENDKSLKNRYHLLEMLKLKAFESIAFKQNFSFCFTNNLERDMAVLRYGMKPSGAVIFPNMMPETVKEQKVYPAAEQDYILFFGTLNSVANQDAFVYLATEIYPLIAKNMQDKDLYIYIVGKNPPESMQKYAGGRIRIIGAVDDIAMMISNSRFVVLPLRIASGTRTRILEAAAVKKAVISTSIGAEGFDFGADEIMIKDSTREFADAIRDMIRDTDMAITMGKKLWQKSIELYSAEVVATNFLKELEDKPRAAEKAKKLKLAIVTNRFYPEVGGAETNIGFQAKLLAEHYELSVLCPKRIPRPQVEVADGYSTYRFWDIFNFPVRYPNLKAKTLCPALIWHLLTHDYDVIQCFPALNYNNMLAFLVAKLRGIPFIMCFFDFIDYAGVIKRDGRIDPNILSSIEPPAYQKLVLKGMDYAFAIAEKEIAFLRRYNPKVEYSPVPILSEEYESEVPNPRSKYGIKDDEFVFLSLGRLSYIKGQDIALEAFAKVADQMPNARLVFVGRTDYEAELFADMQALVSRNALSDKVLFTGMLDREEVLGWLRYSDIHVIPVRFMNSGAVVVESWISDTPVIQSDVVDPNLVVEDYNGYLFNSEDADGCAGKMVTAYKNKAGLPILAENGKALVKTKYTYEYLIDLYGKTYRKLVSNRNK